LDFPFSKEFSEATTSWPELSTVFGWPDFALQTYTFTGTKVV